MKYRTYIIVLCFLSIHVLFGCDSFLDEKQFNTTTHPTTLRDARAMLDYEAAVVSSYPGLGELASDDFETSFEGFSYMLPHLQDVFIWEDQGHTGEIWRAAYNAISVANAVLESLGRNQESNLALKAQLEGEALFLRGSILFNLAQIYCPPYSVLDDRDGLGLVLRLNSETVVGAGRSTLKDTYKQIFSDLTRATELLPDRAEYVTRASRLSALGLLARTYLTIEDYTKAENMVDEVLRIENGLLDFNILKISEAIPLSVNNNTEIINFAESATVSYLLYHAGSRINMDLYNLYEEDDIRKQAFFQQTPTGVRFKGFYHGKSTTAFYGMAIDEMYLIKAECAARRGDLVAGAAHLNQLLEKRYREGQFEHLAFGDANKLLDKVLEERRKELVLRGVRWLDLRRLNRYPEYSTTLKRTIPVPGGARDYTLPPRDLRYTFLIPQDAVDIGAYEQNLR